MYVKSVTMFLEPHKLPVDIYVQKKVICHLMYFSPENWLVPLSKLSDWQLRSEKLHKLAYLMVLSDELERKFFMPFLKIKQ
jgi:hypothetical protein